MSYPTQQSRIINTVMLLHTLKKDSPPAITDDCSYMPEETESGSSQGTTLQHRTSAQQVIIMMMIMMTLKMMLRRVNWGIQAPNLPLHRGTMAYLKQHYLGPHKCPCQLASHSVQSL